MVQIPPPSRSDSDDEEHASDGRRIFEALRSARTPEEFCRGWLAMQCRIVEGVLDAVVVLGSPDGKRFAPVATWPHGKATGRQLGECAERALAERRTVVLKREAPGVASNGDPPRYQVAHPISVADRLHGVVALDVGPRQEAQIQTIVGQLANGSAWLEGLLARNGRARAGGANDAHAAEEAHPVTSPGAKSAVAATATAAAERSQLKAVLDVVATMLGQERFQGSATALVTEIATRFGCERVSLATVRRRRCALRAMSHSAQFGKKTNLVRAIERAMDETFDQEASVVYPQSSLASGTDFRITRAHAELAREYGCGAIASIPLSIDGQICAVLTLERPGALPFDSETVKYCEALGAVAGPLLELRRRDDRNILAKAADSGRKLLGRLFGPRHLGWKIAGFLTAATVAFFAFATGEYRVSAKTVLEGEVQRAAVAPFNGYVATAPMRAGDVVRAGEVLATLDDRELRLEHVRVHSELEQLGKQHSQALARQDRAQVRIKEAEISKAKARLEQIEEHLARMRVIAPFDGVVVQGDLSQSIGAPVQRGDVLFQIAPLGKYRVIQEVDERDIAEVAVGQRGRLILETFPTESHAFTVTKVTPVSTAREGRNFFRVEAGLDAPTERLRPGMEGVSKIEIDTRRLIWIWTHRAVDWVRLALWKWLP